MYEIKLKEKPKDREFFVLVDEEMNVTVEYDSWNKCPELLFKKYEKDKRFEFKEAVPQVAGDFSFPQNRQVRDNIAMAQYKRTVKVVGE